MAETAQLGSATMKILDRDFGLRPGMDTDAIRAAMHKEQNHGHSSPEGYIEGADGGKKLKIGQDAYTPGQLKALLDAQALPAQEPGARLPGRTIQEITASIRAHAAMMARGYIAIGRDLIEAKALLGHGKFLPWLAEMGFGVSAANKYMQLAAEIAQGSPLEELPYSKALALIALPGEQGWGAVEGLCVSPSGRLYPKCSTPEPAEVGEPSFLGPACPPLTTAPTPCSLVSDSGFPRALPCAAPGQREPPRPAGLHLPPPGVRHQHSLLYPLDPPPLRDGPLNVLESWLYKVAHSKSWPALPGPWARLDTEGRQRSCECVLGACSRSYAP